MCLIYRWTRSELSDLGAKRPGTGIEPNGLDLFIGKKLTRAVCQDDRVDYDDIK